MKAWSIRTPESSPTGRTWLGRWGQATCGASVLASTLVGRRLSPEERAVAAGLDNALHLFRRGEPLALMPYVFLR